MVQIYPLFDQYHLWWAAPIPLAAAAAFVAQNTRKSVAGLALVALLVPFALASLYEWQRIAARERDPAPGGVLSGMRVYPGIEDQLLDLDALLQQLPDRDTRFHCMSSLFASWPGTYAASTAAHTSWAYGGNSPEDNGFVPTDQSDLRLALPPVEFMWTSDSTHIVCAAVPPGPEFDTWLSKTGLSLVDSIGPFQPRYDPGYFVYRLVRP